MEKDTSSGSVLRKLREKAGLSVKEVVERLKDYGQEISDKTLYSYESQKRATSGDMLLALCQIYKCNNILETFANVKEDYDIPDDDEWSIIEGYRLLDPYGREAVKAIIKLETKRSKDLFEKAQNIDNLKLQLTAKDARIAELEAVQSPATKEQATTMVEFQHQPERLHSYPYLGRIACAGTGFYFDDIPTDTLKAPYMEKADYIIGVSGESMEPDYHDGEKLYVQKVDEIHRGQVGIFTMNNECFLKEFGDNGLVSRNPDYTNIPGNEDVRLIGRVMGKVEEL